MRQVAAVVAIVTAFCFASGALAATWTVDAGLADESGCVNPTYACKTIVAAVAGSLAGDTINVLAGTYAENVTIGAQLTLNGAQAGTDACDRPGTGESIVSGAGDLFTLIGARLDLVAVWSFADIANGLMAIPNLVALLGLSGAIAVITKKYFDEKAAGMHQPYNSPQL